MANVWGERGPGRLNADTCGQRGRGVKNWQILADDFYGKKICLSLISYINAYGSCAGY